MEGAIMKYLILMALFFLVACSQPKKGTIRNVTEVVSTDSSPLIEVEGKNFNIDFLCPQDIECVDTMLLLFEDYEEVKIKAYGLQSGQLLGNFLRKGGGPDEVTLFSGFRQTLNQDSAPQIIIQSYPQYLAVLDLNRTLKEEHTIYEHKFNFSGNQRNAIFIASNSVYYINENTLLLSKDPKRSGKIDDDNIYLELYDYNENRVTKSFYATDLPFIPNASLLYKGAQSLKPDYRKMVLLMYYMPMFSITDIETGASRQFFPFGKEADLKKYIDAPGDYYTDAFSTNQRIIALYKDGFKLEKRDEPSPSYFHIFDWEGNLLHKIKVKDDIKCFSLNEKTGIVYAALKNDEEIKQYDIKQYIQ